MATAAYKATTSVVQNAEDADFRGNSPRGEPMTKLSHTNSKLDKDSTAYSYMCVYTHKNTRTRIYIYIQITVIHNTIYKSLGSYIWLFNHAIMRYVQY
jgi:hypothetical protein